MTTSASTIRPPRRPTGFTLVELLIVVVIIVILVGLLVPALSSARNAAKKASTTALMQSVLSACAAFRADHAQRQPGFFTPSQIGSQSNDPRLTGGWGITMMQSVLLDLAGGVVAKGGNDIQATSPWQARVLFQCGDDQTTRVVAVIDPRAIGNQNESKYFNLPGADLYRPCDGKINSRTVFNATVEAAANPSGNPPIVNKRIAALPDLTDNFGLPILLWARDPLAGGDQKFAQLKIVNCADQTQRGKFYWLQNASMLSADQLGRYKKNQRQRSALGKIASTTASGAGAGGNPPDFDTSLPYNEASDADVQLSMEALLGNPAYPVIDPATGPAVSFRFGPQPSPYYGAANAQPLAQVGIAGNQPASKHPGEAIGDLVLHSAGVDGYYLQRTAKFLRATYDDSPTALEKANPIDKYDDFTVAGGS